MAHWSDSHGNVADLIRDLEERGEISTAAAAADVAEKPWHFEMEWDRYAKEHDALEVAA